MKNLSVKPRKDDVMISFDMGAEHLTYYVFDDLLKYCQEKEISFERVGFLMAMYDDYKFGKISLISKVIFSSAIAWALKKNFLSL